MLRLLQQNVFYAILWFNLVVLLMGCSHKHEVKETTAKINRIHGFNLVAPRQLFSIDSLQKVKETGSEWVSIVPYAFCIPATGAIFHNHENQWWGEKPEGVIQSIKMAQSLDLKVMLKPHLWVSGQGWAGDLDFENDSLWEVFERGYLEYIKKYAEIADSMKVEMFCIGTEIKKSTSKRQEFWADVIYSTRQQYSGLLTYAANWDEFGQIPFWDKMDYIGVDAYFPLSDKKNPNKADLVAAWKNPYEELKELSLTLEKPLLFTEYGYESIDYNTKGHWMVNKDTLSINFEAQKIAFDALYEVFDKEAWWAGGFIWKWHLTQNGLQNNTIKAYTPQNKEAIHSISNFFKGNDP